MCVAPGTWGPQCPQQQQLLDDAQSRHLTSRNGVKPGSADWVVTTFCGQLDPAVIHHHSTS